MPRQSITSSEGRQRVVIEGVTPEIDGGQFPIKRARGEPVAVEADVFVDGHEVISCALLFRREQDGEWREAPMEMLANDRWRGVFVAAEVGRYVYTLTAWVDRFKSWRRDLRKKVDAGAHTDLDMLAGASLIEETSARAGAYA
jgi:starch synthase (maltosyl-transferring)